MGVALDGDALGWTAPAPAGKAGDVSEQPTLSELKARYVDEGRPLPRELEAILREDPRPGAKKLLEIIAKPRRKNRAEGQRLRNRLRLQTDRWEQGILRVAEADEAG